MVRAQRDSGRRGKREGPQAQARLGVPLHLPGPQREPVRRGVFRKTGQSHLPPLPDLHLQTQHHRDLLHPAGGRGADEPGRMCGVFLRQRPHHDPQVRHAAAANRRLL